MSLLGATLAAHDVPARRDDPDGLAGPHDLVPPAVPGRRVVALRPVLARPPRAAAGWPLGRVFTQDGRLVATGGPGGPDPAPRDRADRPRPIALHACRFVTDTPSVRLRLSDSCGGCVLVVCDVTREVRALTSRGASRCDVPEPCRVTATPARRRRGLAAGRRSPAAGAGAAPAPTYEMPFPCGQAWTGTTRASHSPSRTRVDWNRADDVGDPVVAAAPGVGDRASTTDAAAATASWVVIDHGNGETSRSTRTSTSVTVAVGQRVDQGALLGTVGETGQRDGAAPALRGARSTAPASTPFFHGPSSCSAARRPRRTASDVPVAGNFVGGREAEVAVFRRADAGDVPGPRRPPRSRRCWASARAPTSRSSATGTATAGSTRASGRRAPRRFQLKTPARWSATIRFGGSADLPIAGDWDGDGRWEIGVAQRRRRQRLPAPGRRRHGHHGRPRRRRRPAGDRRLGRRRSHRPRRLRLGHRDVHAAPVDADGLAWTAQVAVRRPGRPAGRPATGTATGSPTSASGTRDTATFVERGGRGGADVRRDGAVRSPRVRRTRADGTGSARCWAPATLRARCVRARPGAGRRPSGWSARTRSPSRRSAGDRRTRPSPAAGSAS